MDKHCKNIFCNLSDLLGTVRAGQYFDLAEKIIEWLKNNPYIVSAFHQMKYVCVDDFVNIEQIKDYPVDYSTINIDTFKKELKRYIDNKNEHIFSFMIEQLESLFLLEIDEYCSCQMQYPQRVVKLADTQELCVECWACGKRRKSCGECINSSGKYLIPTIQELRDNGFI